MASPNASSSAPIGNGTTATAESAVDLISERLLPELLNIFTIILLGFLAGRLKILPPHAAPAFSKACGVLLLPTLLFTGLATIDFYSETFQVMATFLYAICIAKVAMFAGVAAVSLATDCRAPDRWAKAGIRGIFVTQSNDFALGLPIFMALYGTDHPEFAYIFFLAAPISLLFINPLAFVMMEFSNTQQTGERFSCKTMLKILLKVFKNPITWSAFLGFIVNFCTTGSLPSILYVAPSGGLFGAITVAFPFVSQFALGMVIVGKLRSVQPRQLPVPCALIFCKVFLAPFVGKAIVQWLGGSAELAGATFIYGALPTAGGVFLYALQYNMAPHRMAIAVVLCTIVSGPVLFAMSVLGTASGQSAEDLVHTLVGYMPQYMVVPSYLSIAGCLWYMISSTWGRRRWAAHTRVMRHAVMCVVVCTLICGLLQVSCQNDTVMGARNETWALVGGHVRNFFFASSFAWTAALALLDVCVTRGKLGSPCLHECRVLAAAHAAVWVFAGAEAGAEAYLTPHEALCNHPQSEEANWVRMGFRLVSLAVLGGCVIPMVRAINARRRLLEAQEEQEAELDDAEAAAAEAVAEAGEAEERVLDRQSGGAGAATTSSDGGGSGGGGDGGGVELARRRHPPLHGLTRRTPAERKEDGGDEGHGEEEQQQKHKNYPATKKQSAAPTHETVIHAAVARLVLVLYMLLFAVCVVVLTAAFASLRTEEGGQNATNDMMTTFEIQFVSELFGSLVGVVLCCVYGFNKVVVLSPCVGCFKRTCKCTCCGNVAGDPTASDPMWSALTHADGRFLRFGAEEVAARSRHHPYRRRRRRHRGQHLHGQSQGPITFLRDAKSESEAESVDLGEAGQTDFRDRPPRGRQAGRPATTPNTVAAEGPGATVEMAEVVATRTPRSSVIPLPTSGRDVAIRL